MKKIFVISIGVATGVFSIWLSTIFSIRLLALAVSSLPIILLLFYYIVQKEKIDFLNPLLIFSLLYFLFFGLGGFLYEDISNSKINIAALGTILGVLGYVLGFLFVEFTINKNQSVKRKMQSLEFENFSIKRSILFEKILFAIGFFSYVIYVLKIGGLPILMGNLEQARVDASLQGGAYLRLCVYLLILSAIIGVLNIRLNKLIVGVKNSSSVYRFWISVLAFLSLGNRSPVFNILFISCLILLSIKYKGRISFLKVTIFSTIGSFLVISFVGGFGAYRVLNTETFYSFPEFRPFIENKNYIGLSIYLFKHYLLIGYNNFLNVLDIVPTMLSYQFGSTYAQPILTVLPGQQFTLDMQIKMALGQTYLGGGTVPSVLGEAYVNFGIIGCLIVPFIVMFILNTMRYQFINNPSPGKMIIYIYLLSYLSNCLLSGIAATSVFPFVAVSILIFYHIYVCNFQHNNITRSMMVSNISSNK
ncbi:O-antigen polymerase [Priestia megaterium]|uniref:O-antigen polymerase n=1 Tax=Priestia megaterium TaxID=1404 RepID=UPI002453402E|nr:O-antigen polymerase [Priestia megaterium]MDH3159689.1 O-antigen ligase [Priestia megaterium]MED4113694.1 O-antigen ligase [Priestia megaterium]